MRRAAVHATLPVVRRAAELWNAGLSWEAARRVIELETGNRPPVMSVLRDHAAALGLVEKAKFTSHGVGHAGLRHEA